jgi:hypothetical protein
MPVRIGMILSCTARLGTTTISILQEVEIFSVRIAHRASPGPAASHAPIELLSSRCLGLDLIAESSA